MNQMQNNEVVLDPNLNLSVKIYSVVYIGCTKTTLFFPNILIAHFFLPHKDCIYNW